jgi:hypothetical protein
MDATTVDVPPAKEIFEAAFAQTSGQTAPLGAKLQL